MWDRFNEPAVGVINGKCGCRETDMALCKQCLEKYTTTPMSCEHCGQRVVIAVVERFGATL